MGVLAPKAILFLFIVVVLNLPPLLWSHGQVEIDRKFLVKVAVSLEQKLSVAFAFDLDHSFLVAVVTAVPRDCFIELVVVPTDDPFVKLLNIAQLFSYRVNFGARKWLPLRR